MSDNNVIQASRAFQEELKTTLKSLTPRQVRNALKRSYRVVGGRVREVAISSLRQSFPKIGGSRVTFEKSLHLHIYSKGGGFLITMKPRQKGNRQRAGERGMHENRFYQRTKRKLPILQWLEDGTERRTTKGKKIRKKGRKVVRGKGRNTGRVGAYHFLARAQPKMYQTAESLLGEELKKALEKTSSKLNK